MEKSILMLTSIQTQCNIFQAKISECNVVLILIPRKGSVIREKDRWTPSSKTKSVGQTHLDFSSFHQVLSEIAGKTAFENFVLHCATERQGQEAQIIDDNDDDIDRDK